MADGGTEVMELDEITNAKMEMPDRLARINETHGCRPKLKRVGLKRRLKEWKDDDERKI